MSEAILLPGEEGGDKPSGLTRADLTAIRQIVEGFFAQDAPEDGIVDEAVRPKSSRQIIKSSTDSKLKSSLYCRSCRASVFSMTPRTGGPSFMPRSKARRSCLSFL